MPDLYETTLVLYIGLYQNAAKFFARKVESYSTYVVSAVCIEMLVSAACIGQIFKFALVLKANVLAAIFAVLRNFSINNLYNITNMYSMFAL